MTEPKNFYITTPIYYVNDVPHIGHAYTSIACDTIARFKKLQGYNVHFLTGTDEHGQKVQKSALDRNKTPQQYCDEISGKFRELADLLKIEYDDFIRTTEDRHKKTVKIFWEKLQENGWIYKDVYEGWYSIRDEAFYGEDELINGKAPTGAEVIWQKEESYFFRLSKFQKILENLLQSNAFGAEPDSKRKEALSFVKGGLIDLSISRTSFDWGIKVPNDAKHVIYVWLDALVNYLSALNYPDGNNYKKFWNWTNLDSTDKRNVVHIVGKDILRFHAIYWPAFLLASQYKNDDSFKEIEKITELNKTDIKSEDFNKKYSEILSILPTEIFAHGWWTNEGQKISKSVGNVIDPIKELEWLESFNVLREISLDYFRYFLLREVPFGNDGDYSREHLINRVNSEVVNNIGNLLQRSASMLYKEGGEIIDYSGFEDGQKLLNKIQSLGLNNESYEGLMYEELMSEFQFGDAIGLILVTASFANGFFEEKAPWTLKKEGKIAEMKQVLSVVLEIVRCIAIALQTFCINGSTKILNILNIPQDQRQIEHISPKYQLKSGHKINQPEIVFPRLNLTK